MTHKVTKSQGKFQLVPTSADVARAMTKADQTRAENKINDTELPGILHRILERLDALESK